MNRVGFEKEVIDFFKEQFQVEVSKFSFEKEFDRNGMQQLIGKVETTVQSCWVIGNDEGIFIYSDVSGKDADTIYKFHLEEMDNSVREGENAGFLLGEENIDEEFIRAVGRLTINFAHLEFCFSLFCGSHMRAPNPINEIITAELSFKQLLNISASIFHELEQDNERLSKFDQIVGNSYELEQKRNTIIHSFYGQNKKGDGIVIRQKTTAKGKKGFKRHYEELNAKEIDSIADTMSETSKELVKLIFAASNKSE